MNRADFWCRVLGWLQIGGALAVGAAIYVLWAFIFGWIVMEDPGFFAVFKWIIIIIFAFPPLLSGLLTVVFADRVEQAQAGMRDEQHVFLRVVTALAGLWSAGVVGFVGLSPSGSSRCWAWSRRWLPLWARTGRRICSRRGRAQHERAHPQGGALRVLRPDHLDVR